MPYIPYTDDFLLCRQTLNKSAAAPLQNKVRVTQAGATSDAYPLAAVSQPVYSLATNGVKQGLDTLNIVTYCAPMSINPRTVALGLYKETQSWDNFVKSKAGVLQA